MGHRATIYNVRVHRRNRPTDVRPLGNIDESGSYLGDFLIDAFDPRTFEVASTDGNRDVKCSMRKLAGADADDVEVILNPGERGVRANILEADGQIGFEQTAEHTQLLSCGSLFRLPRKATLGFWACHVNNNRSVKSLVDAELQARFRERFDDLILDITPSVNAKAFETALEQDRLLSASLIKYERPSDIAAGRQWARQDTGLKYQLHIRPERGKRLVSTLVRQALRGDRAAFGQIVDFGGVSFDSASFEVELENGIHRTFNIEQPESGHAFSEEIGPEMSSDGAFREESLFKELGRVLTELG